MIYNMHAFIHNIQAKRATQNCIVYFDSFLNGINTT